MAILSDYRLWYSKFGGPNASRRRTAFSLCSSVSNYLIAQHALVDSKAGSISYQRPFETRLTVRNLTYYCSRWPCLSGAPCAVCLSSVADLLPATANPRWPDCIESISKIYNQNMYLIEAQQRGKLTPCVSGFDWPKC